MDVQQLLLAPPPSAYINEPQFNLRFVPFLLACLCTYISWVTIPATLMALAYNFQPSEESLASTVSNGPITVSYPPPQALHVVNFSEADVPVDSDDDDDILSLSSSLNSQRYRDFLIHTQPIHLFNWKSGTDNNIVPILEQEANNLLQQETDAENTTNNNNKSRSGSLNSIFSDLLDFEFEEPFYENNNTKEQDDPTLNLKYDTYNNYIFPEEELLQYYNYKHIPSWNDCYQNASLDANKWEFCPFVENTQEFEFLKQLHMKLARYTTKPTTNYLYCNPDPNKCQLQLSLEQEYFDKVRFQEISFKFSKTYH